MRNSLQENKIHYKNYFLLLIICLLAYWPISFGIFSAKGDSIQYFLPYRYNISQAIQHGELPFWSPYIYLGNPVYGDMQSGAWNPFVWFFSLFKNYDLTIYHIEYLVYIFLAGIGTYKLVNYLYNNTSTALLSGTIYMLSGFMLGGQLINWAASAAFFPFVIYFYLLLVHKNQWSAACKAGLFLYLLLVCGYPSFFIIVSYLLLLLFIFFFFNRLRKKTYPNNSTWSRFIFQNLLVILVFVGLSLPAIISYFDLLPYYDRGGGVTYWDSNANTFEWQHFLTFFFPPTTGAPYINSETDLTCRNIYFGFLSLIIFVTYPPKLTRRNLLLLFLILFSALFSLGDATPVRKFCYNFLPLMDTFRHPSQMRLFFIFGLLLLMAPGLNLFFESVCEKKEYFKSNRVRLISFSLAAFFILSLLFSYQKLTIFNLGLSNSEGFKKSLKKIIDNLHFYDVVFVSAALQLIFIIIFLNWFFRKSLSVKKFYWLWTLNLFVMAQLVLPITFVSQASPKEINKFILQNQKNYPIEYSDKTLAENSTDLNKVYNRAVLNFGLSNFYKKTIAISHITYSPSFLTEQEPIFMNDILYNFIASKPAVYIADSVIKIKDTSFLKNNITGNFIISNDLPGLNFLPENFHTAVIKKMTSNRIEVNTNDYRDGYLVLTQSYHHQWKVWVDGKRQEIYKVNIAFMGTYLPAGNHNIVFRFIPENTLNAIWVMLTTIFILITTWTVSLIRQYKSRQQS